MIQPKTPDPERETLEKYKLACWEFLLEHCDVLDSGTLFVKFHTKGRLDFEKRVRARWKWGYHREDVKAKQEGAEAKAGALAADREAKRKRYEENRRNGKKKLAKARLFESIKGIFSK